MARLENIISTALLISLLAVAVAPATTTVITTTTTVTDADHPIINSRCKHVDVMEINHCKMYLTPDPIGRENAQSAHLFECCGQLDELETKCRCMGIKEVLWILKNQKSRSGTPLWDSQEIETMEQDAQDLLTKCNIKIKEPCVIVQAVGLKYSKM